MFISPSIAAGDYLCLKDCVDFADQEYGKLHFTIADGHFVPYITFGMRAMRQLCDYTKSILSVHLLVTDPLAFLEDLSDCYPETVFIHLASLPYPLEVVNKFRAKGIGVGLALTPRESLEGLGYVLPHVDGILQMTSEPDDRGREFIEELRPGIRALVATGIPVWLEGGILPAMVPELEQLGVSALVMGQSIFRRQERPEHF